jgi:hypothetical protein
VHVLAFHLYKNPVPSLVDERRAWTQMAGPLNCLSFDSAIEDKEIGPCLTNLFAFPLQHVYARSKNPDLGISFNLGGIFQNSG